MIFPFMSDTVLEASKPEHPAEDPQILRFKEDLARMCGSSQMSRIRAKLKSGADLTPKEFGCLKRKNPELYLEAKEIKQEKESYKRQIKECNSKEDVEKLKVFKTSNFMTQAQAIENDPKIPEGKKFELFDKLMKKTIGVASVHLKFTKTKEFRNLPESVREISPDAGLTKNTASGLMS